MNTPIPISETVWMVGIVAAEVKDNPQVPNAKILSFVLQNGRQYLIPLQGDLLKMMQEGISPVILARSMPRNSHGI